MMKLRIYQIDAFADQLFTGNPAAVIPLEEWLSDELMQNIAIENNLSETAFFVKVEAGYEIRWFTPASEVELCGHATLATAFVIFTFIEPASITLNFSTRWRGNLQVTRSGELLELNFPVDTVNTTIPNQALIEAMGATPVEYLKGETDVLLVYKSQSEIEALQPNFFELSKLPLRGIIATAPGDDVDFVSRFFAPAEGINEDPVTGSAHTTLLPYWSKRLGKYEFSARQLSKRGGNLKCKLEQKRVKIAGKAKLYLEGIIQV